MALKQVDRYEIAELIGRGAMGRVYRAFDPDLHRPVALKFIQPPAALQNDDWYRRFRREVRVAAQLNHPHIVTIYDVGLDHDPPYVVMELLSGRSWREYLDQNSPS